MTLQQSLCDLYSQWSLSNNGFAVVTNDFDQPQWSLSNNGFAVVTIHSFYIALFSALEQTHCAHWHVILDEWLYLFIARIINIHGSGVLIALFGCCMAGAT